ncbi:MAG: Trk family potassium uptake protein [Deltaproteobacteria bacterium]|nr:Trk family potassium uptake protein [Deltaproteobacteria bacterium]
MTLDMRDLLIRLGLLVIPAERPGDRRRQLVFPSWAALLATLLISFVAVAEFALSPAEDFHLQNALTVVNMCLVSGFLAWVSLHYYVGRRIWLDFFVEQRVNILLVVISLILSAFSPRAGGVCVVARLLLSGAQLSLQKIFGGQSQRVARLSPSRTLALSFAALISIGAALLMVPAATTDGLGASLTDAIFTTSSATSVTGLVVQNTGTYWTPFGLGVLLLVMQTGAIGIMVLAAAFAVLVGGRLPSMQLGSLDEAGFGTLQDLNSVEGLKSLVLSITAATVVIELIGALLLFTLWGVGGMPLDAPYDTPLMAAWWCMFHSISAFCHAGFSLESDSLMRWASNPAVNVLFMSLITLGALGFPVLADLWPKRDPQERWVLHPQRMWRRFHIQTKVVLVATAVLNLGGMLFFLFFEYDGALHGLSVFGKLNAASFQSVTLRSAGFNTVPWSGISGSTLLFSLVWMFIGSAPASTGGGIRMTTAMVVLMAVRAMLRGRDDVELFGRRLPQSIVYRSIAILLVAAGLITFFAICILATQTHLPFDKLLFETMSAFGTVGLSMGITADLDTTGRWLMSAAMYVGRVGPLTMALAIGARMSHRDHRYPEGKIAVG